MGIRLEDLSPAAREQAMWKLAKQQGRKLPALRVLEQGGSAPSSGSKFHNEPTQVRRVRFDSKKEARRFEELLLMEQAGQVRNLRLQQDFTLQEAYTTPSGERVRAIRYRADFAYERPTAPDVTGKVYWIRVVEDVKSCPTRTKDYIMKQKMMQDRLGITIHEV